SYTSTSILPAASTAALEPEADSSTNTQHQRVAVHCRLPVPRIRRLFGLKNWRLAVPACHLSACEQRGMRANTLSFKINYLPRVLVRGYSPVFASVPFFCLPLCLPLEIRDSLSETRQGPSLD